MSVVLRMRKAALVELTNRGLLAGGGQGGGRVKGDTKLSCFFFFKSVGLRKTGEGHYSYNLSWVQMKGFCGNMCGAVSWEERLAGLPCYTESCLSDATILIG